MVIIAWLAISILMGCKATKETSKVDIQKKTDSLVMKVETTKSRPIIQNWTVKNICDSVGVPKEFEHTISNGVDSIQIQLKNNQFIFDWKQIDSLKSVVISNYQKQLVDSKKEDNAESKIFLVPGWCYWSILANVVLLMALGWVLSKKWW